MNLLNEIIQIIAIALILFCPGVTFLNKSINKYSKIELFLFSFIISLFYWTILSTLGFLFNFSLSFLIIIQFTLGVIGLFILLYVLYHKKLSFINIDFMNYILLSILILAAMIMYWKGSYQDGDSWYHVAQSVNYSRQNTLFSENAFFSGHPAGTLYDFNSWHTLIGGLSLLINIEPRIIWINLSTIMAPLFILSFYYFLNKGLTKNKWFPILSIVLFILVISIQRHFQFWGNLCNPGMLCEAILTPVFIKIILVEKIKHKKFLIYFSLITCASIHSYYYLKMILLLIPYFIITIIVNDDKYSLIYLKMKIIFKYILVGIPFIIVIYLYCYQYYSSFLVSSNLPFINVSENVKIYKIKLSNIDLVLSIITSLLIFIKYNEWHENRNLQFVISNSIFIPLIIFNPIIYLIFSNLIPINLIGRLSWNIFILIPIFWVLFKSIKKNQIYVVLLINIFLFSIFIVSSPNKLQYFINRIKDYSKYDEPMGLNDFAVQFKKSVEPKSVIISDSYTSYHLPVFADVDIVSMIAHSTPPLDLETRIRDNNRFFIPFLSAEIRESIRKKYNIEYAVVNQSTIPWTNIENSDTLFTASLYPYYNCRKPNTVVLKVHQIKDTQDVSLPNIVRYNDRLAIFPAADQSDNSTLIWKHAGMIYLKIEKPDQKIIFHSKGGTHHVFYYSVIDRNHQIIEEKIFVNDFSQHRNYRITNLPVNSWVIFSGNGISPLTVQIED